MCFEFRSELDSMVVESKFGLLLLERLCFVSLIWPFVLKSFLGCLCDGYKVFSDANGDENPG